MKEGYWDIQNHILPGVDDGSSGLKETRTLLEDEYRQGIRSIVFTPRYRPGVFDVPHDERERIFQNVCAKFQEDLPDMHFYLGCEVYVNRQVFQTLNDRRCRLGGGRTVLLDFHEDSSFQLIESVVRHTVRGGCRPLIAHAEYCNALYKDTVYRVRTLQAAGAWIQIDAGSVLSDAGHHRMQFCETLLTDALADVIASNAGGRDAGPVRMRACARMVEDLYGSEACELLFERNPARLMRTT